MLETRQNHFMKTLVIIPAYNEELNIVHTVNSVRAAGDYEYIVINDGSKDNTAKVCKENNIDFIDLPVNLGLNGSFQTGILYAFMHSYDYAVQIDGDGQHKPEYIRQMIDLMEVENADIVIGSRFVREKKPATMRMLGNNLIQFAIKVTTGKTITDPTSGMRLYNKKMLEIISRGMNFGPEPDTVAFLIRSGFKVTELQVEMLERTAGQSMYVSPLRSVRYMLTMFTSILFAQFFRKVEK